MMMGHADGMHPGRYLCPSFPSIAAVFGGMGICTSLTEMMYFTD